MDGRGSNSLGAVFILGTSPAISNSSHHLCKPDVILQMKSPRLQEVKVIPLLSGETGVEIRRASLEPFSDITLHPPGARCSQGYADEGDGAWRGVFLGLPQCSPPASSVPRSLPACPYGLHDPRGLVCGNSVLASPARQSLCPHPS